MAKMRVHELAKEIDRQSKELIEILNELGIEGKTTSSSLDEDQVAKVREKIGGAKKETKAPKAEKAEKAEKPEKPQ